MSNHEPTLVSVFDVGRYAVLSVTTAVVKEPLVYALWTAIFLLAGGMMLFLVTTRGAVG
ncbi:MAG TPA: hypothetical protein VFW28_03250 [Micropepsaceae bacterium]|nr:hypothetical protein [Micropepsaceae bacterium]